MNISSGWFCANVADPKIYNIAYFSAEYGLHHALPFYAGGLGFLAGDFLKECSDLGIPLVAVGFMYPQGYLRQMISPDGWQVGACEMMDRENAPIRKMLDEKGAPHRQGAGHGPAHISGGLEGAGGKDQPLSDRYLQRGQ